VLIKKALYLQDRCSSGKATFHFNSSDAPAAVLESSKKPVIWLRNASTRALFPVKLIAADWLQALPVCPWVRDGLIFAAR